MPVNPRSSIVLVVGVIVGAACVADGVLLGDWTTAGVFVGLVGLRLVMLWMLSRDQGDNLDRFDIDPGSRDRAPRRRSAELQKSTATSIVIATVGVCWIGVVLAIGRGVADWSSSALTTGLLLALPISLMAGAAYWGRRS